MKSTLKKPRFWSTSFYCYISNNIIVIVTSARVGLAVPRPLNDNDITFSWFGATLVKHK